MFFLFFLVGRFLFFVGLLVVLCHWFVDFCEVGSLFVIFVVVGWIVDWFVTGHQRCGFWSATTMTSLFPDASSLLRAVTQFSHMAADTIVNGGATSHSAPTDQADRESPPET